MLQATQILDHPRNTRIKFLPEPHEYYYRDDQGNSIKFDGVTGLLGNYSPFFDRDSISKGVARKRGISQQQVLAEWKETNAISINRGNYIHDALETFVKNGEIVDQRLIEKFVEAYEAMGLRPVAAEWTIYDESIGRASSIDGNFIDANGKYVIVDYKTNKDGVKFDSYKSQRMLFPVHGLLDSKHSMYSLQVSMYRYWVEKYYLEPEYISNQHWILHIGNDEQTGDWKFSWISALDLRTHIEKIYDDLQADLYTTA